MRAFATVSEGTTTRLLPGGWIDRLHVAMLCLTLLAAPAAAEIAVTDDAGRRVQLDQPATRVIALAPHIVENTFSAGAGDALVGVVKYGNYPPRANSIEQVGDALSWSLEKIAALEPDLILMWGSGNGLNALPSLEQLGLPVYVSEPRSLDDIPDSIEDIGLLTGHDRVSRVEAERLRAGFSTLRETYRRDRPLKVFYEIWNEPLQTINGEHLISHVIELCGGHNVFGDVALLAPKISVEAVLHAQPDAIVASGMDEARPEWLDAWRDFTDLPAVRNDALLFVPPDHLQRPTARILLGASNLCEQLAGVSGQNPAKP